MDVFTDLSRRHLEPEIMDDPDLDAAAHIHALDGLARLNWWSSSARLLWAPLYQLARRKDMRRLRVLDIATGAGDLPLELWRRARKAGLDLHLCGVDVSDRAVETAERRSKNAGASIEFRQLDVLTETLPADFDVVVSSLFLHHLTDSQARSLLAAMHDASRELMIISDLVRSRSGLWLVEAAVRILTRSPVVHFDGPLSVRAAFSIDEIRSMLRELELHGCEVRRRWPNRFVVTCLADRNG